MHPTTERIIKTLGSYNADLLEGQKVWDTPFLWESEKQGKFEIWKFLVSEGFVYSPVQSTKVDRAIKHWQSIEFRGTPTVQEDFQYAPYWKERKDRVSTDVLRQRANIYQALSYFLKHNLQNIEVHELSDSRYTDNDFKVYIILGQTLDQDWFCLIPTVPNENPWRQDSLLYVNLEALTSCESENSNTQNLFEKLNKILACLSPLTIYGYYDCTYKHQILCTTSSNKTKAIKLGLQASRMLGIDKSLSAMMSYPAGEQVSQFMQEALEGCRRYTISFWESGYEYYLGFTDAGDWLGFKHRHWCDYNP